MDDRTARELFDLTSQILLAVDQFRERVGQLPDDIDDGLNELETIASGLRVTETASLEKQVKRVMRTLVDADELRLNATELAELAADELDIDTALDDSNHAIWDWAVEVIDEWHAAEQSEDGEEYEEGDDDQER